MSIKKITEGVFALHSDICHTPLFEGVWGIPTGASLNSYILRGDKTCLIDCVGEIEGAPEHYEAQCKEIGLSLSSVDYLVLNHLEPDHSGYIAGFRAKNPKVEILSTKMGSLLVQNFFGINDGLRPVATGDTLDLGKGMVLSFVETPNVHWPETMMTLLAKEGILFSCDGFGGYGATGERLFDDEYSPAELKTYEGESLRYYANIVATFSTFVKKALEKLKDVPIKVVAPSHGILWRKNPKTIVDLYAKFAGYNTGGPQEKEICVVWGTMHGNTKIGLDAVLEGIKEVGVPVTVFHVPGAASSEILAAAFKSKGILFAMPTYEYKMFTPIADMINLFAKKHLTEKIAFRLGSWGWVGGAQKDYEAATAPLDWTQVPAYEWQGVPKPADLEALKNRGREFAKEVAI